MTRPRAIAAAVAVAAVLAVLAGVALLGGDDGERQAPASQRVPTRAHAVAPGADGRAVAVVERFEQGDWQTALVREGSDAPLARVPVDGPAAVVAQADGALVVAGDRLAGGRRVLAVARVRADGRVDERFGEGGVATVRAGSGDAVARGLAVAAGGGIVVVGDAREVDRHAIAAATLDRDGRAVRTELIPGATAAGAAADANGRVLVAGTALDGSALVARLSADGALDAAYGDSGIARAPTSLTSASWRAVAVTHDGGAVVVGAGRDASLRSLIAVASVGVDGSPGAENAIPAGEGDAFGAAASTRGDGSITAGGTAVERDRPVAVTVAIRPDGSTATGPVRRAPGQVAGIAGGVVLTTNWESTAPRARLQR
jgi:hypothetical protein